MEQKERIPDNLYKQILENMPVLCVDIIISYLGKVLLIRRGEAPAQRKWWVPGGRLYKNERILDAAKRKALKETNLNIQIKKMVGIYEYFSKEGKYPDMKTGTHTPVIVFLAEIDDQNPRVELDRTSLDYMWIGKIEENLEPYIKKILKDSGAFN